ncbi:MAG: hypothetical protein EBZ77_07250 [Chitinophagia bacterium]|nr:hypothetical protein [Chitinophagia bacterium]
MRCFRRLLAITIICFGVVTMVKAQVFPAEGSKLHYRLVPFKWIKTPAKCTLQIAEGNWTDEKNFLAHLIATPPTKGNTCVAEVPHFGAAYTWRVKWPNGPAAWHHFTTLSIPATDTNLNRMRIVIADGSQRSIFSDGSRVLYNSKAQPIWFLPEIAGEDTRRAVLYDLKMSPQHTITFILNNHIYEIDWNGKILWKGPNTGEVSGDTAERYHHEFTRLSNGHYLVLGNQQVKLRHDPDEVLPLKRAQPQGAPPPQLLMSGLFGTIIEYDRTGKVVWQWKTYKYLSEHVFPETHPQLRPDMVHENAVYFDDQHKVVYLSMKNANEILKIAYPSGEVLATYGPKMQTNPDPTEETPFCQQHSCKVTAAGELYMFNNNMCRLHNPPNILLLTEPERKDEQAYIKWQFDLPFDMSAQPGGQRNAGTSGGSVTELPDGQFFISQFKPFGDMYVVTRGKAITWHGVLETRGSINEQWRPQEQYRASVINTLPDLQQLVLGCLP